MATPSDSVALRIGTASLLAVALLPACAKQYVHVPQAVGPAPTARPSTNTGTLVVTTERLTSNFGEEFPSYEPYEVFDSTGRLVKQIDNASGADAVELTPGRYSLRVPTLRRKIVGVDVRIAAGQSTEVHLDNNWQPNSPDARSSFVFGPEGAPIGYQFAPTARAP